MKAIVPNLANHILKLTRLYFLAGLFMFWSMTLLTNANADGWEAYSVRPNIIDVEAQNGKLGEAWDQLKAAHFAFVATLLEIYPDREIYFLARDSEYLYDVAKLVTHGTQDEKRIHLLNVSRGNMQDPNLKSYLAENGITEKRLSEGQKILFVDTGFSGTIPKMVASHFSANANKNLKTQLIVSSNSQHPSSRSFLVYLNPDVIRSLPASMHGTIVNYEHMEHFTDRSSRYGKIDGHFEALSLVGVSTDGKVSREKALAYMADLKSEWAKPEVKASYRADRQRTHELIKLLSTAPEEVIETQIEALKNGLNDFDKRRVEALILDLIEAQSNAELTVKVSAAKFHLPDPPQPIFSAKNKFIESHPKLEEYLIDPVEGIKKLIDLKDWQTLGLLIDSDIDHDINGILFDLLFDKVATGPKRDLQVAMIKSQGDKLINSITKDSDELEVLASHDLLTALVETVSQENLRKLIKFILPKTAREKNQEVIEQILVKGDLHSRRSLSYYLSENQLAVENFRSHVNKVLWDSVEIENQEERQTFLTTHLALARREDETNLKRYMSVLEPTSTMSGLYTKTGIYVQVGTRVLRINRKIDSGKRGVIYELLGARGAKYALKIAIDNKPETIESIKKEKRKETEWASVGLARARVLAEGANWVLKPWIPGLSGEEVMKLYAAGDEGAKVAIDALKLIVLKLQKKGVFIGDFRPPNLIWTGKAWVIFDGGTIQDGNTLEKVIAKWSEKFEGRWNIPAPKLTDKTCEYLLLKVEGSK